VIAEGPPEEIVKIPESYTGRYLARMLPRSAAAKKRA
jgi:excinuclease ABC subunit A